MSFDQDLQRGVGNGQVLGAGREKHHVGWMRIESVALDAGDLPT
jgi:hypothetical protein